MVSERDVHDRLREAIGQLPRTTIEACAEEIGRLRSQIDYATAESRAAWSGEVNVVLLRLEERLFHAHALALRAANEAEAWIAAGSAGPPVTPSAPRGGVSAPPPQARRPIEERMADAVRALPPRTPRDKATRGVWVDDHEGTSREERSGEADAADADEMVTRLGLAPPGMKLQTTAHVEIKVAVKLRESPNEHVHLAINNALGPCRGPYGCAVLAPQILQPGQKLTVYWPGPDGTVQRRTFTGQEPRK